MWLIGHIGCGRLDITYVRTVSGFAYTAFVTDVHGRTTMGHGLTRTGSDLRGLVKFFCVSGLLFTGRG